MANFSNKAGLFEIFAFQWNSGDLGRLKFLPAAESHVQSMMVFRRSMSASKKEHTDMLFVYLVVNRNSWLCSYTFARSRLF